jgi:molybdopterin/thiamine biosynthesis adenylyltransferase
MAFMARRHPTRPHGLLVVADRTITGIVQTSGTTLDISRLVSAGIPTQEWTNTQLTPDRDEVDDRQLLAIGAGAQQRLANATIAVIGNSGGGSHVTQQLIHAGTGTLLVIDPDIVEETNLRRMVGATRSDVGTTPKPDVAVRTAEAVRSAVKVIAIREAFPSTVTIEAIRHADVIIGCVDGWDTRDDLNSFALRHRIPYIDIGITVAGTTDERGMRVGGQTAIVVPDGACLRCMGLVTDERVQMSREHRQGYANQEPDPQVVSLNGTLASEAVTAALMLLAGDDRLVRRRRYTYPPGLLTEVTARRREGCTACSAAELPFVPGPPRTQDAGPDDAVL